MKKARFAFAVAVLFLLALPSSAAICGYCDEQTSQCVPRTGYGIACYWQSCLEFISPGCARAVQAGPEIFAADYSVASVEVTTPAKHDDSVKELQPRVQPLEVEK
jgi:hypothetical protein